MLRYVCFAWDSANPRHTSAATDLVVRFERNAHGWQQVSSWPGLCLYVTNDGRGAASVHALHGNRGVVLGTIFENDTTGSTLHRRPSFDVRATEKVLRTSGRNLVRHYWGNYVAVVQARDGANLRSLLLRGPASSIPCLNLAAGDVQIYCSSIEDCSTIGLTSFSIDWQEVAARFLALLPSAATGLREVSQVLPGECVDPTAGSKSAQLFWNPYEIARENPIEDPLQAERALHRAVKTCVHSWAACHESIMLNLSGGLDSSIVLACLRDAPTSPRVVCLTEYSPGADSDEREYARLAVARAGCAAHIEALRNQDVDLRGMLFGTRTAVPQGYFRRVETTRSQAKIALDNEADAIYSGSGGDQLFCQSGARLSVADFVKRKGVRTGVWRVAYDAAQLEGDLFWRILGQAIRDGVTSRRRSEIDVRLEEVRNNRPMLDTHLLRELIASGSRTTLGSRATPDTAPGTHEHVCGLAILDDYYDPMGQPGDPEQIAPLFSQPLMETTLRIPSYLLMIGGWDRGLTRRAFLRELPVEIARRRSKGGIGENTWQVLRRNTAFAREMLLDGLLVQHRLLRREMVVEALSVRPSGVIKGMAEVCSYLDMEAWLRLWTYPHGQRAAA